MEISGTSQTNRRKHTKTSVACIACQNRKTKCSGGPAPCDLCTKLNTRCVIHPESDMRRRDSRGHYKAYQALLEAFIASTRRGDSELSTSLYRTIELTDTSGKLAEVAQCFVQVRNGGSATSSDHSLVSIDGQLGATFSEPDSMETLTDTTSIPNDAAMARSPFPIVAYDCDEESSAPAFTPSWAGTRAALPSPGFQSSCVSQRSGYQSSNLNDTPPKGRFVHLSSTACTSEDQSLQTYEQLLAFWDALRKTQPVFHLQEINVGSVAYDTKLTAINDNFSNMIAEFRYGARHAIRSGTSLQDVLGTCVPSLGAYFYPDANKPILSAWDFACNFCATIPGLPVDLQLTMIYLVGLQMRVR